MMLFFPLLLYWMDFQSKVLSWLNSKKFCSIIFFTTSSSPCFSPCFLNSSFSLSATLHFLLSSPNHKLVEGRESTDYLLFCLLQYLAQWPEHEWHKKMSSKLNSFSLKNVHFVSAVQCLNHENLEEKGSQKHLLFFYCAVLLWYAHWYRKNPQGILLKLLN